MRLMLAGAARLVSSSYFLPGHDVRAIQARVRQHLDAPPGSSSSGSTPSWPAQQLLVTAGDNRDRLRSEASFARLCGAAPIPVSSGRTDRHRLHRCGVR
jgi:hypothetical protein